MSKSTLRGVLIGAAVVVILIVGVILFRGHSSQPAGALDSAEQARLVELEARSKTEKLPLAEVGELMNLRKRAAERAGTQTP